MPDTSPHKKGRLRRERALTVVIGGAVLAVLIFSFSLLLVNINRVNQSTERVLNAQAETVAHQTTDLLNSYARLCETLTANQSLYSFAGYDGSEGEEALTVAGYSLRKDLNSLVAMYGSDINTLAVYFTNSDAVITMARQLTREQNHLFFDSYPDLSPAVLQQIPMGQNWLTHFSTDTDSHCYIIRRISSQGNTVAYAMVEFDLDGFVTRISPDNSCLFVGNADEILYCRTENEDVLESLSQTSEVTKQTLEDCRYITVVSETNLPDVRILVGVSTEELVQIQWISLVVMAATGILVLASIVILVFWLNRQLFAPVEYLLETTRREAGDVQNSLRSIAEDFVAAKLNNDTMRRERSSILPLALGRQLNRMTESSSSEDTLLCAQSSLLLAGLRDGEGYALFAVCCAEDRSNFFKDMRHDPRLTTQGDLFHYLLNNVLTDLVFQDFPGTVAPFRDEWFLVILSCGSAADAEQIETIVQKLLDTYEKTFDATLVTTHTFWGTTPAEFARSVFSISQEISYMDFWGSNREAGADDGMEDTFPLYRKLIRKVFARLNLEDYDSIPALLDELFAQTLPSGVEDLQTTKHRIYALSALILASIDEQLGGDRNFTVVNSFEQRLYHTENIADFKKELTAILNELAAYKKAENSTAAVPSKMEEVKQYILEHYTENELTASSIAAEFQMSGSYLSRAFKEHTGTNILDYIQKLRVEKAKTLLATESVKVVAQQVGFWDTQGLVRAFKKHEGVTPSEFRKLRETPQS